jgi:ElaB/YqjD/DUF883 family membrane-anchored ribosome-binding protein
LRRFGVFKEIKMASTVDEFGKSNLADSAKAQVKDVTDKAHRTVDRAASATPPLVERAASSAHAAIDATSGAATRTVDTVGQTADRLRQIPAQYADTFVEGVRQNPWAAIGIAVLVGFVLGRATD